MAEITGHFLSVDHGPNGVGFAVDLNGHNLGRLFMLSGHPTYEAAFAAAYIEAERRGGLKVVDRIGGDA